MSKMITCGKCGQAHTVPGRRPGSGGRRTAFHLSESDYIVCACGCELWKWGVDNNGYARVAHYGKPQKVSRILLGIVGDATLDACHHCDNPRCIREEDHLYIGTAKDNMRDMALKDRHGNAKILNSEIPIIRARVASSERQKDIAAEYGVSHSVISQIVNYKSRTLV